MIIRIDDDLYNSGRLRRLASYMGWSEMTAIGGLVNVWRRTQSLGISSESLEKLHSLICIDFNNDDEAMKFLHAMSISRLATIEGGTIFIRGNDKKLGRTYACRERASRGGIRQKKTMDLFGYVPVTDDSSDLSISNNRLYVSLYEKSYGQKPVMNQKSNAVIKSLTESYGDKSATILENFFKKDTREMKGHSISWLSTIAQQLMSEILASTSRPKIKLEDQINEFDAEAEMARKRDDFNIRGMNG